MRSENSLSAIIIGVILVFMVWMIPNEPEIVECEVQTIPVTHRVSFYYACGLTSWDMVEWSEPTAFEKRRIEKWSANNE